MKKKFIVMLCIFSSLHGFSQQSVNFGIIYGQRLNHRGDIFNRVVGISTEYTLPLWQNIDIRLSAGIEGTDPNLGRVFRSYDDYMVIPFRVGIQPYIYEDKAYLFAETGLAVKSFPFDETGEVNSALGLSLALGGGYRFTLNERKYIQPSLSYNYNPYKNVYKFSWINLRVAYGLQWGGRRD